MLTRFQMKNKMKVLLVESHKAPVVAVQMWVKTGSADEKKGEEGISHFIEHLVFKGTRKFGVGEVARTVEGAGGELNAFTTFDHTVFHVTMSREDHQTGLECISEMMGFPKFDPVEIDREREVVIEEIKRSFDNPYRTSSQQMFSTVFKKHPYGIPVIGFDKNIRKVSRKTLVDYYHRRYVPSNMTLVVAGDFSPKKMKGLVTQYFGGFESHSLKKISRVREPAQKTPRFDYKKTQFKEASLNVAFRVPPAIHKDVSAIDVMSFVLGQGDSSRLVRRLRLEKSLVTGVSAGSFTPADPGLFAVTVSASPENFKEITAVLTEEIVRLLSEVPSVESLERARMNLESDEIYGLETVDGLARKVGSFQTLLGDPNYIEKYLKQVQGLKPADLVRVARKYLTPKQLTATLMLNTADAAKFSAWDFKRWTTDLQKAMHKAAKSRLIVPKAKKIPSKPLHVKLKTSPSKVHIFKHRLNNGALVLVKRNPEVPIVSFKAAFLGGQREEGPDQQGATTLLSNVWTGGSEKYSEVEINDIIEGNAAGLSAFGGRNSIGLSFDALNTKMRQTMPVFKDVLLKPVFPHEIVDREIVAQLENIKHKADHPSSLVGQLFLENIFAGHPYSRDMLGTAASVKAMTSHAVRAHFQKMMNSDNAAFCVVGDVKPEAIVREIESISDALGRGKKHEKVFEVGALKETKNHFQKLAKEQSHIIVGYRGLTIQSPDRFALQVLSSVLAGQGGRLFLELRDKASLAYSVSPIELAGLEAGYFGAYIGCSPEKGVQAIKMMHEEFEKMMSEPIPHDELERAKRYLVGRNHIDLQRNASQASSILFDEIYGIDCNESFNFAEHINKVTSHDVQRLAQQIFGGPCVRAAVGPIAPF